MKTNYLLFIFALFLLACEAKSQEADSYLEIKNGNILLNKTVNEDVCGYNLLSYIPSPLEIALLTKGSIKTFDKNSLYPITNNYKTNNQKALALGIYSTAMGYCNLYDLEKEQAEYLATIKNLASDLQLTALIHFEELPNKVSFDSMLNFAQRNHEKITANEKTMQQSYETYLLCLGGFIEVNYQTLLLYEKLQENRADSIFLNKWRGKIGEQKLMIEQFTFVFDSFDPQDKNSYILNDLKELENCYKPVKVMTKRGKINFIVENGEYFIEDNIEAIVTISDSTISQIAKQIKAIRSKIVR